MCIPLCLLLLAFSAWGEVSPVAKAKGRCLLLKGKEASAEKGVGGN